MRTTVKKVIKIAVDNDVLQVACMALVHTACFLQYCGLVFRNCFFSSNIDLQSILPGYQYTQPDNSLNLDFVKDADPQIC